MTWVKLDEGMTDHPKVARLSDRAFRLHISGLCYSNRHLTDGEIPMPVAHKLVPSAKRYAAELVTAGVWDEARDSYHVHDFDDYQPSKAQVLDLQEKRAAAGRVGGRRSKPPSKREANALAKGEAKRKQNRSPVPGPYPDTPTEVQTTSSGVSAHAVEPRARNEQWDGLEAVFGYSAAGKEAPLWGKLTIELRDLGATKPSIEEAARRYRSDMPTVTLTPTALVKHYQRLMAAPVTPRANPNGAKADLTLELARQARAKEIHAGQ